QSLISTKADPCRPVLSVWPIQTFDRQQKWKIRAEAKAPFYTLGAVSIVTCNNYYKYDLERRKLNSERLQNADCSRCKPITRAEAILYVVQRLRASGYDTSSLVDE
ncbi:MAG TPA: hypothetical protein VJ521_14015, partial [Acidobacteriota bacterium]|nr:hypothetical protein [Acidobacteriota bacterium]